MPKHSISPPYRSALAISKSKDIQKYMTTIPKPLITSSWHSWNMKKLGDNKLQWYPSEYDEILDHLDSEWRKSSVKTLENLEDKGKMLFYVTYDLNKNINSSNSWKISIKELELPPFKGWRWKYDPKKPEYLIYVMDKWTTEDISSLESLERMKDIIETALKIVLANS